MPIIDSFRCSAAVARRSAASLFAATVLASVVPAAHAVGIGEPAPPFRVTDASGKTVALTDFRGQHVVLEWTNPGCPFVQKHYHAHNMQRLQAEFTARDVVWLSISSTATASADYLAPAALGARLAAWGGKATAVLIDEAGTVGKAYGAKTTPHMVVIDPAGRLLYAGGIDDKRSADSADVKTAKNHVRAALDDALAGRPVATPTAPPYGCSIKYAS